MKSNINLGLNFYSFQVLGEGPGGRCANGDERGVFAKSINHAKKKIIYGFMRNIKNSDKYWVVMWGKNQYHQTKKYNKESFHLRILFEAPSLKHRVHLRIIQEKTKKIRKRQMFYDKELGFSTKYPYHYLRNNGIISWGYRP